MPSRGNRPVAHYLQSAQRDPTSEAGVTDAGNTDGGASPLSVGCCPDTYDVCTTFVVCVGVALAFPTVVPEVVVVGLPQVVQPVTLLLIDCHVEHID